MAGGAKLMFLAVVIAMAAVRVTESEVTCKSVVSSLTPCTSYLTDGGQVPETCCDGVKSLYKDADTAADRQTACRCMEQASTMVPGIKMEYATTLPGKCDVHIPYPIDPNFNCSSLT